MKGICGKIMEKKLMIKRMGIGIVICAAVVGMLLIGIREDMLVIERRCWQAQGCCFFWSKNRHG